jgi:hypothetical protein
MGQWTASIHGSTDSLPEEQRAEAEDVVREALDDMAAKAIEAGHVGVLATFNPGERIPAAEIPVEGGAPPQEGPDGEAVLPPGSAIAPGAEIPAEQTE